MDAGTRSAKAGVVAQVPHKHRGEWFVRVATIEEGAVVRILKSRVSSGVTRP